MDTSVETIYSIFPSIVIQQAEDFHFLKSSAVFPRKKKDFKRTEFAQNCYAFTPFTQPQHLVVVAKLTEQSRLVSDHLTYTHNTCRKEPCSYIEDFKWESVIQKYKKNPPTKIIKKSNNLLCFRQGNVFLVKCFFTFGLTLVQPQHVHVIQTLNKPVLFYVPKVKLNNFVLYSFDPSYQNLFHCYVLRRNTCYAIPSQTVYMIMTTQKCYFKLDVCLDHVVHELWNSGRHTFYHPYGCTLDVWRKMKPAESAYHQPTTVVPMDSLEDREQRTWIDTRLAAASAKPQGSSSVSGEEYDEDIPAIPMHVDSEDTKIEIQENIQDFSYPEAAEAHSEYILSSPTPSVECILSIPSPLVPDSEQPMNVETQNLDATTFSNIDDFLEFYSPIN